MKNVIVVGGGPAGMMAAGCCAERGRHVVLLEKNASLGRKLMLTGKGRCNVTNASPPEDMLAEIMGSPYFLYSAFYSFDSEMTAAFFEGMGVTLKTERGKRVFPVSDRAGDIAGAMKRYLRRNNVEIICNSTVVDINIRDGAACSVTTNEAEYPADSVIIATGGMSYQGTGSTGDGYRLARKLGHHIIAPRPSLVPLLTKESWLPELQGLTLRNVAIKVVEDSRIIYEDFGELLFTHFGVSGPVILSASRMITGAKKAYSIIIDLKPALSEKELDERILRDFEIYNNKELKNALGDLLPRKMIPVIAGLTGIPDKRVHDITRDERKRLCGLFKNLTLTVTGNRGWNEAVITSGGVHTDEVSPSTMESKLVSGLYFAGEILDVDGPTGGYNLQIAFSTGYLAGTNA